MPEGRESPPPERQSGRQLQDPTGSGKASDVTKTSETDPNHQLDCLSSNPKGPMDDALEHKFSKGEGNWTPLNC
ncbi:hypothetical protein ACHAO4_001540 [Trichoderma viride]